MITRITGKKLQLVVDKLNRVTGNHVSPFTMEVNHLGLKGMTVNVGTYVLSYAYGGVCLDQIEAGNYSIVFGYQTKRDLYNKISALISGFELRNSFDGSSVINPKQLKEIYL